MVEIEGSVETSASPVPNPSRTIAATAVLASQVPRDEYAELKSRMNEAGLLEKRPLAYIPRVLLVLGLLAGAIGLMAVADSLWLTVLDAVLLAFVFTQLAFIGHDAGHRQIFTSVRGNELFGLVVSFLLGLERTWWVEKHNRHHNNPNHLSLDPDADFPVLAFTKEQAVSKAGVFRFIVKYQAFFFFPMLLLEGVGMRLVGAQYMWTNRLKYSIIEPAVMFGHAAAYFGLALVLLGSWHALVFIVVHQAMFGLYMGSVFAPNHKGMPMFDGEDEIGFLRRQVLTARNVVGNVFTDYWYGGLNRQIEHHLFPSMPRGNLKAAREVVKPFCEEHSIEYYETGMFRSQIEIVQHLHSESAPLREKAQSPSAS